MRIRALFSFLGICGLLFVFVLVGSVPVLLGGSYTTFGDALIRSLVALVAFLALPLLFIRYVLRGTVADYGWRLPEHPRAALRLGFLIAIPHFLVVLMLARDPSFGEFYSLAGEPLLFVLLFALPVSAAYYLAEEFLFRGFFLFSLSRVSVIGAYAANALFFAFFHTGKLGLEILLASASALLLSWLSRRTKSFLPAACVHWCSALLLLALVNMSGGTGNGSYHF